MKKLKTLVVVLGFFTTSIFAQLNVEATILRDSKSENISKIYLDIKDNAQIKWGDDSKMVFYNINKQSTAFFDFHEFKRSYKTISENCELKWSKLKGEAATTNYVMTVYCIKKQLKSIY